MLFRFLVVVAFVLCARAVDLEPSKDCPCPTIPIGNWVITLSEPIAFGYRATGTFTTIHLYDEIYYGAVQFPGWIPFAKNNLRHMGYLNKTSCAFKGSMADVPSRRTVTYNLVYVKQKKTKVLSGGYHRMTNTYIDERIGLMNITFSHDLSPEAIAEFKKQATSTSVEM